MKPSLTEQDVNDAAQLLKCEPAAIWAVCDVEAPRGGFNPDGTPVTLFEGHKFYSFTNGIYAQSHPSICYPRWDRSKYGKSWQAEQQRLQQAMQLDRRQALKSASWGRFQIMGFNYSMCGFVELQAFINAMYESERAQLMAFVEYLKTTKLDAHLRFKNWAAFAKGYNGPSYEQNLYDVKLANAYEKRGGVA